MPSAELLGPKGIGGWLILPLIGLILSVVRLIWELVQSYNGVLTSEGWAALTGHHPLWGPAIVFEVACNALLLVYTVLVLTFFLRKSRRTPALMVAWLIARAGVALGSAIFMTLIESSGAFRIGVLMPQFLVAGLWVVYFRSSDRVKNTFVR